MRFHHSAAGALRLLKSSAGGFVVVGLVIRKSAFPITIGVFRIKMQRFAEVGNRRLIVFHLGVDLAAQATVASIRGPQDDQLISIGYAASLSSSSK